MCVCVCVCANANTYHCSGGELLLLASVLFASMVFANVSVFVFKTEVIDLYHIL